MLVASGKWDKINSCRKIPLNRPDIARKLFYGIDVCFSLVARKEEGSREGQKWRTLFAYRSRILGKKHGKCVNNQCCALDVFFCVDYSDWGRTGATSTWCVLGNAFPTVGRWPSFTCVFPRKKMRISEKMDGTVIQGLQGRQVRLIRATGF